MNKAWIYVFLTCFFEIIWVYGFNTAKTWWEWAIVVGIILLDFYILPKACETLPTGTVYAIFSGVGTIGTVLMDVILFDGTLNIGMILCIILIIIGVIGLNLADNKSEKNEIAKGAA
ncbi:DMT family transporter [Neobacillus mesonae]|uniref:DMT family transporter n=1 Tax=Neobacillus mesonae TaxID=1193713 RepID=UPI000B223F3B